MKTGNSHSNQALRPPLYKGCAKQNSLRGNRGSPYPQKGGRSVFFLRMRGCPIRNGGKDAFVQDCVDVHTACTSPYRVTDGIHRGPNVPSCLVALASQAADTPRPPTRLGRQPATLGLPTCQCCRYFIFQAYPQEYQKERSVPGRPASPIELSERLVRTVLSPFILVKWTENIHIPCTSTPAQTLKLFWT
jgi:hypothetical protein